MLLTGKEKRVFGSVDIVVSGVGPGKKSWTPFI